MGLVIVACLLGAALLLALINVVMGWLSEWLSERAAREPSPTRVAKRIRELASRRQAVRQRAARSLEDNIYRHPWQPYIKGAGLNPEHLVPLLTDRSSSARRIAGIVAKELGWQPRKLEQSVLLGIAQRDCDAIRRAGEGYRECLISIGSGENLSLGIDVAWAMGKLKDPVFIESLHKTIRTQGQGNAPGYQEHHIYDWIRNESANALGEIGDSSSVAILTESLEKGVEKAAIALAKILGPIAIHPILQYLFYNTKQIRDYHHKSEDWSLLALESAISGSAVDGPQLSKITTCCRIPVVEQTEYSDSVGDRTYVHVDVNASFQAAKLVCDDKTPVASNILHLLATRPAITLEAPVDRVEEYFDRTSSGAGLYGFENEKKLALTELAQRGNPPYDMSYYLRGQPDLSSAVTD
jgi:hypothetical protein